MPRAPVLSPTLRGFGSLPTEEEALTGERSYYHINWSAFDEEGNEKYVPLAVSADDGERAVLLFDSFERAKRYMHTFLIKNKVVGRQELDPNIAVITVRQPVLGSSDPGHMFSVGEKTSADVIGRAARKSRVKYALLNPGPLESSLATRSRIPLAEL